LIIVVGEVCFTINTAPSEYNGPIRKRETQYRLFDWLAMLGLVYHASLAGMKHGA